MLSLSNKPAKIVSVLSYTQINHYMIILVQVLWKPARISKPYVEEDINQKDSKTALFSAAIMLCSAVRGKELKNSLYLVLVV